MTLAEILIAVIMAIGIGILFYYGFKVAGPWESFWAFILILVLAGITSIAWVTPIGPPVYGVSWLGALIFILIFALLIAAATPVRRHYEKTSPEATEEELRAERPAAVALGAFFWFLLIIMAISAIAGLIYAPLGR